MVWIRDSPEEKTLLLLLSNGFTSKSDNGGVEGGFFCGGWNFSKSVSMTSGLLEG